MIDLQANLLDILETRVVAPLIEVDRVKGLLSRLNPRLEIDGKTYVVEIPAMAAVPKEALGPSVANLSYRSDELIAATDFLLQGF